MRSMRMGAVEDAVTVARFETETKNGFPCVSVRNERLRVDVLPDVGGKLISLRDLETSREFFLPPQPDGPQYRRAFYGAPFDAYDVSGFDDCFPTVEACRGKLGAAGTAWQFPDHGEVWSMAWSWRIEKQQIVLAASGVNWPYRIEKRVGLSENGVRVSYRLENLSTEPLAYLWSAHPLLNVRPGARILLPADVTNVLVNWSSDDHAGRLGDIRPWPHLDPQNPSLDYSDVKERETGLAAKVFTGRLQRGMAAVYDPQADESLAFQFDVERTPYLGLWLCYGGWPPAAAQKHLTVALEPCSGRPDSLAEAMKRNEHSVAAPRSKCEWEIEMSIWRGVPPFLTART